MSTETYFSGVASNGEEGIWKTNGTVAGTILITNLYGESNEYYGDFTIAAGGSKVAFEGGDSAFRSGLFFTDGTKAGTHEVVPADGATANEGLTPTDITAVGNDVVFGGYDKRDNNDLWVSNGTVAGTHTIKGTQNLEPENIFAFGGKALFTSENRHGLWVTNGASVQEIAGTGQLYASEFAQVGGKAFFVDARTGNLYSTDGTAAGTRKLTNVGPAYDVTTFGSRVIFESEDKNGDFDLFVSDGTAGGTHEVAGTTGLFNNLQYSSEGPESDPPDFIDYKGKIYFQAGNSRGGYGLFETDGSSVHEITGIKGAFSKGIFTSPSDPDFNGPDFAIIGGKLVFDGASPGGRAPDFGQTGLWVSDGTAAGTKELKGIKDAGYPGELGFDPTSMTTITLHPAAAREMSAAPHTGLARALFDGALGPSAGNDAAGATDPHAGLAQALTACVRELARHGHG